MANPKGINQYTRHGAGALRTKTGAFYHGTTAVFSGAVQPRKGKTAYATASIATALSYGGRKSVSATHDSAKATRILVVAPGAKASIFKSPTRQPVGAPKQAMAGSRRAMPVVGVLPTLHKPSRK